MHLLIANFDCQEIVTKEQVVEAVNWLPRQHVNGIQVIRYDPTRAIAKTLSYMGDNPPQASSLGLFYHDRETAVIVLFRFDTIATFYHVLFHEIGHYVFLKCLRQEQRDEWMYRIRPSELKYPSAYAQLNSREDFAESYAFYCSNSDRMQALPMRSDFLGKEVFAVS